MPIRCQRRVRTQISLLVPLHGKDIIRRIVWNWLRAYYRYALPGVEIVIGKDRKAKKTFFRHRPRPFSKTTAINKAFKKSHGDIIVVLDADAYIQAEVLTHCAERIRLARKAGVHLWFVPYQKLYRLTLDATIRIVESPVTSQFPVPVPGIDVESVDVDASGYGRLYGAMVQVFPREAFTAVGGADPRFCVDEETEILTRAGWKTSDQVTTQDVALTLNHKTGLSEWQPIQAVNKFRGSHEMLSIESKTHSSLTTLNHRWPVINRKTPYTRTSARRGYGFQTPERGWATSGNFTTTQSVPTAAQCIDLPLESKYNDAFVEVVAWFWTEGSISRLRNGKYGRNVTISQSLKVNPDKCERIAASLTMAFGPPSEFLRRGSSTNGDRPRWYGKIDRDGMIYTLNAEAGELVQNCAPGRVPSYNFLLALTQAQLNLFISVSMLGDGHRRTRSYEWMLSQKSKEAAEAFQFACVIAGHSTSLTMDHSVLKSHGYNMTKINIRQQRFFKLAKGAHKNLVYEGTVWCPTTSNGTWLARRRGKVYFTGNSGWGSEDLALVQALDTLWGPHKNTSNDVLHLWHPRIPGDRRDGNGKTYKVRYWEGQQSFKANEVLAEKYQQANGDPEKMRSVINER